MVNSWFIPVKYYIQQIPLRLISIITLVGLSSLILFTAQPVQADTPGLLINFQGVGYYDFVSHGVGTRGDPVTNTWSGAENITLTIPLAATNIVEARIVWTGRAMNMGLPAFDADGLQVSINSAPNITVTADKQYNENPWFKCPGTNFQVEQLHESADLTAQINALIPPGGSLTPGTAINFSFSDHEHGTAPTGCNLNYGVGVWIVYEYAPQNPAEDQSEVVIYEGQDSFFRNFTPTAGPHSDVQCVDFAAESTVRQVSMEHFVSGVDPTSDADNKRSSAFWYLTGTDANRLTDTSPVPGIINLDDPVLGQAIGYRPQNGEYPLYGNNGLEWDNFDTSGFVEIPAGHTWACFQIESGDSQDLAGLGNTHLPASGMWNFFSIKVQVPTSVSLTSFTAVHTAQKDVSVSWETASESDNFGFSLYRSAQNQFATASEIHFEPTAVSGGSGPGAEYVYSDQPPGYGTWFYWLEDIDTNGKRTVHGPVTVRVSPFFYQFLPLLKDR